MALDRLLSGAPVSEAEQHETLGMIRRNLEAERRLIDDMLDVTRVMHGKLEIRREFLSLHALLSDVARGLRDQLSAKRLEMPVEFVGADPWLHGDPVRLRQVFWNILNNAVKFTPASGRILVRARQEPQRKEAVIEITDTGAGIAPECLGRIFDAFEQTNSRFARAQGGLGLGLAISRSLVEAHGGSIEVESPGVGRGTTFRVRLPQSESPPAEAPAPECGKKRPAATAKKTNGAAGACRGDLRICIVDDHADTVAALSKLFQVMGHRVSTASTLDEACAVVSAEPFDVLISDQHLPDGSGCDLLTRLPASHVRHAVVLSGSNSPEELAASRRAGFQDHLLKPISVDQVQHLLASLARDG
jgi:CheY-like chemotaxis protein